MSGAFSENFLNKYFGYRARYVEYIRGEAPDREGLAVLSEILRLTFVAAATGFCALLFWLLTVAALGRGAPAALWLAGFAAAALGGTWLTALALRGLLRAVLERRRIGRREAH